MSCKWDREFSDYLTPDGKPCLRDDWGDPTRHCTARRTCSQHVGPRELTCARCLGRVRQDIRGIVDLAILMPYEALADGVESEAAMLAGPAADAEAWSWRKVAAKQGVAWHLSLIEDDDDWHPYTVLTRWEFMLREDYKQRRDDPTDIGQAGDYLDRTLHRMAQDDEQDFGLLRREIRTCRQHMEAVLRNSRAKERGAPCPTCLERGVFVRLAQEFGHWCTSETCEQIHFADDSGDVWRCPVKAEHWWNPQGYADMLEERRAG